MEKDDFKNASVRDTLLGFSGLPQGRRAAICADNVTEVSDKDEQSDAAQFLNSVESFICQSTIIPADGRGFRMSISSQSITLAETFIGETPVSCDSMISNFSRSLTLVVSRSNS